MRSLIGLWGGAEWVAVEYVAAERRTSERRANPSPLRNRCADGAAGIVMIALNPGGLGVDGFAMAVGGGLSVLLINFLFRVSVSSNVDREREEDARRYFDEHGKWPEDETRRGRRWTLAPGVMTAEDAAAEGKPVRSRARAQRS
jgi:hypothetical protein